METLINLAMRRDIKAWRDRWIENIANDLGKSIPDLQAKLDAECSGLIQIDTSMRDNRPCLV